MIKTIIIDDEPDCCEVLATLLERNCPEVKIDAVCYSVAEAITAIQTYSPNLVFLDIEMPYMNGFELLESLPEINFEIIFTTSYDQYAIKAIRFSALDYLLKPVDRQELQLAVDKALRRIQQPLPQQLEILMQKFHQEVNKPNRIALPTLEGLQVIPLESIISCSSNSNYTILSLKEKQKLTVSRTLKDIEEMLGEHNFLRVHHSFLVNINEVRKYIRGEGGSLVMSDGSSIDVSRSKKELLLRKIQLSK